MGQAKQRGTKEERAKSALERQNEDAIGMIKKGTSPHYAFVFDRSAVGRDLLRRMKDGPAELKARATSQAVQLWESMPHMEYCVIWGSWGYSGGLTLPTANLDFLLSEALPATMKRTLEKGGFCTFVPAVDESVREAVMTKIAELQPVVSSSIN